MMLTSFKSKLADSKSRALSALAFQAAFAGMLACALACGCFMFSSSAYAKDGAGRIDGASKPALASAVETASPSDVVQLGSNTAVLEAQAATLSKKKRKAFVNYSGNFALNLFKRSVLSKGKHANVAVAPMSMLGALAMTANGASGKTDKQLRKVIAGGSSLSDLNKGMRWFKAHLVNSPKARLSDANSIWYHDGGDLTVNPSFIRRTKLYFDAEAQAADFSDPKTVGALNAWVSEKTEGMIERIIDKLDEDDRMALVNAQYFDAEWQSVYEPSSVRTKSFFASNGTKRKVKMMFSTEGQFIEGDNVRGFIKPYAKGYSFVALLPDKGVSIKKFVKRLNGKTYRKLLASSRAVMVQAGLPKYSTSYSDDNMEDQLKAMGIRLAFDKEACNLSRMARVSKGNLYVGRVVHKTKVDLDEQGTKAAAVSAVLVSKASSALPPKRVEKIVLNRPFVYAIVDNATKLPLFIGTVNDIK